MISVNIFSNISAQNVLDLFELNRCTLIVRKLNAFPEFNENDRVLLDICLDIFSDCKKIVNIYDW